MTIELRIDGRSAVTDEKGKRTLSFMIGEVTDSGEVRWCYLLTIHFNTRLAFGKYTRPVSALLRDVIEHRVNLFVQAWQEFNSTDSSDGTFIPQQILEQAHG